MGTPRKQFTCPKCHETFLGKRICQEHSKQCVGTLHLKLFDLLVKDGARRERLLREQSHRHCEMLDCLETLWKGKPIPLHLDHIDGNPDNNERANLRMICPNCHAQTDTYCGKNVGRHRDTARQKKFERYPSQKYR